jgi:hypothetical protein
MDVVFSYETSIVTASQYDGIRQKPLIISKYILKILLCVVMQWLCLYLLFKIFWLPSPYLLLGSQSVVFSNDACQKYCKVQSCTKLYRVNERSLCDSNSLLHSTPEFHLFCSLHSKYQKYSSRSLIHVTSLLVLFIKELCGSLLLNKTSFFLGKCMNFFSYVFPFSEPYK